MTVTDDWTYFAQTTAAAISDMFSRMAQRGGRLRYCIDSASLRLFISITWKAKVTASSASCSKPRRSNAMTVRRDG